jgi:hypothetical protein
MKRGNNRTSLKLEQLEQRDVLSTVLPGTETVHIVRRDPAIATASFQWGVGRGAAEVSSTNGPVTDVRLRRIVMDAATGPHVNATAAAHAGGSILADQPAESLTLNF